MLNIFSKIMPYIYIYIYIDISINNSRKVTFHISL